MNTHDNDIELPEHDCIYETTNESGFIDLEPAYRKSTVLRLIEADRKLQYRPVYEEGWKDALEWADRKRRGETAGWKLVPETPTSKQIVHMACQIKGADADGWFRTDGDDWPEIVDAAERAYKWALSEAPQPAEPYAPEDCGIDSYLRGLGIEPEKPAEPVKVNAIFETQDGEVIGTTDAKVERVEWQDDGSLTVVIDYWPQPAGLVSVPKHLIERLQKHCEDKSNTAFARSTMREALQYLTPEPVKVPSDAEILDELQSHGALATSNSICAVRALLARYGSTTGEATKKQQKIEQSMHRGARLTDHRFKL